MQELLYKTEDPDFPVREQEFYELVLQDPVKFWIPTFTVRQYHVAWSEVDKSIMCDQFETDHCMTPEEAEIKYAKRRKALADHGFIYSDMNPIF